jgi:hypothetical protein
MPLVQLCVSDDISEALVIRSALAARGIRATLVGIELYQQVPSAISALGPIPVQVSDADLELARLIVTEAGKNL